MRWLCVRRAALLAGRHSACTLSTGSGAVIPDGCCAIVTHIKIRSRRCGCKCRLNSRSRAFSRPPWRRLVISGPRTPCRTGEPRNDSATNGRPCSARQQSRGAAQCGCAGDTSTSRRIRTSPSGQALVASAARQVLPRPDRCFRSQTGARGQTGASAPRQVLMQRGRG